MKKLFLILLTIFSMSGIWSFGQDTAPSPIPTKLIAPNSPVWYYNTLDSSLWVFKGQTGWLKIATHQQLLKYYWTSAQTKAYADSKVSDLAYDNVTWNGIDSIAPSKNAIRDKIVTMEAATYPATTMTVNTGTLTQGTVNDTWVLGGTDVIVTETSGTNPLTVTFAFSGVERVNDFTFFGRYSGGASHVIYMQIYNYITTNWDLLGELGTSSSKQWYSWGIFSPNSYLSSGNIQVRFNHQDTGIPGHTLILDYIDVNFGGSSGGTFETASEIAFVPTGTISATNVQAAIQELDISLPTTYLGLTDTPNSYASSSNKLQGVNSGETAIESKGVTATLEGTVNIPTGQQYQINGGSIVVDAINDGVTTTAPSQNKVFDELALKAPASGSGNYIQNQNASAQSANMWISGSVRLGNDLFFESNGLSISDNSPYGDMAFNYSGKPITFNFFNGTGSSIANISSLGAATFSSTIQATTAKLTNLTDGYIPYHISDASGLGNSKIYQSAYNLTFGGGEDFKTVIDAGGYYETLELKSQASVNALLFTNNGTSSMISNNGSSLQFSAANATYITPHLTILNSGAASFYSTVNSTGYLLNDNNLFSSLSTGVNTKWDGTKFVDYYNPTVQTLSGTTPTYNVGNGIDATITISGNTSFSMQNLVTGMAGTLYITNPTTVYKVKFLGYNLNIAANLTYDANGITLKGSSIPQSIGWKYIGGVLLIHGTYYNAITY